MLICSDGLTAELNHVSIEQRVRADPDPQNAVDVLVKVALQAGGRDNVTVLVIDVDVDADGVLGIDGTRPGTAVRETVDDRTRPRAGLTA